ncbi:MAG TPA: hypothetical protein IAA79_08310 [Candidatus Avirikenella pullistercoris]|nr:hypothetical protein [Candidatus Avirikenella pullistercoris]
MQDIKIVVKKIFWLFGIFFCCCNMQLFAQEGTYVVTDEAPEIPVFNHDNEVIGYLEPGDEVAVTLFHQNLPQADGSEYPPVTFIDYRGEEGIVNLGAASWMQLKERTESFVPSDAEINSDSGWEIRLLIIGIGVASLLFLFCRLKNRSFEFREGIFRKRIGRVIAIAILVLIVVVFICSK